MSIKLLAEHHLEFLSLKVGCTGLSESNCHIVGITYHGSYVLGAQKNCLIETVLLSTHNICFG